MKAIYNGPERRTIEVERWHIKREFQLGHLLTTIAMAVSAGMYVTAVEKRVSLLEQAVAAQKERDERQDTQAAAALATVNNHLSKIDDKLDRLLLLQRGTGK
jgi:uncharacterized membrane protein (DUF106 family)